jgi:integrase
MASVKKREDGKWRARYRDPDGRERAKHFDRRVDAERWLDQMRGQLAAGAWVDPSLGRTTFGEWAQQWHATQPHHRPSTRQQIDSHLRNHLLPAFGTRPIASIRPTEIRSFVADLSTKLAPTTTETVYRWLSAIFSSAVEDGMIRQSPCRSVKLPDKHQRDRRVVPISVETMWALADAAPERHRALIVSAAGTGVRQGEALGLTVDRVDFLRRSLTVDRQLVTVAGSRPTFGPPKTKRSERVIPLPDVVLETLAAHLERFGTGEDGLIFPNGNGEPMARNRFGEMWRATTRRAGIEGVRFHDLRHLYASMLIRHGESVKVVQSRLGHASAVETLDVYGHLWPDDDDRTRSAVDTALGNLADYTRTSALG